MSKNRNTPRKTKNIVRAPATKFGHINKRMRRATATIKPNRKK